MISSEQAAFLQDGVAIHVGTRDGRLRPNGARALAVRVDEGGTEVVVYVVKAAAVRVLPDLRMNRQAAVAFGRPTDDRACQVKGVFLSARPARDDERAFVLAQWAGFVDKMARIGVPGQALAAWPTWPAMAIRLRTTALFEQTPGPAAGTQLA